MNADVQAYHDSLYNRPCPICAHIHDKLANPRSNAAHQAWTETLTLHHQTSDYHRPRNETT